MNLERSASHTLPRGGKVHDGLGVTGLSGRNDAGAGGDTGFLSVLAALDSPAAAGALDPTAVPPGPPIGLDAGALPTPLGPDPSDGAPLSPDVEWQVDTAALLAHLNRSSQWSPPGGPNAPSSSSVGLSGNTVVKTGLGLRADVSSPTALPALTTPALASVPALPELTTPASPSVPAPPASQTSTVVQVAVPAVLASLSPIAPNRNVVDVAGPLMDAQLPAGGEEPNAEVQRGSAPLSGTALPRAGVTTVVPHDADRAVAGLGRAAAALEVPTAMVVDDAKGVRWDTAQLLTQRTEVAVTKPVAGVSGLAQTASDTKLRQTLPTTDLAFQAASESNAMALVAGVTEGLSRQADRVAAKPTELRSVGVGEGQWGPYALMSSRLVEAPSAPQNSALPTPEMMVAEQVSYWIAGKIQNAELRLDVFGRQPVDVSISMREGEAQVEFRTDQPEIRQVLEGATAHLKDLLKEQGLALGGVFVGSSGQQRHGAQPSPGRPADSEVRQVRVDVAEATASLTKSAGRPVAGRSIDLFV